MNKNWKIRNIEKQLTDTLPLLCWTIIENAYNFYVKYPMGN